MLFANLGRILKLDRLRLRGEMEPETSFLALSEAGEVADRAGAGWSASAATAIAGSHPVEVELRGGYGTSFRAAVPVAGLRAAQKQRRRR